MADEPTTQERFAAIAEWAGAQNAVLQGMAATLGQLGEAMQDAMRKTAEEWPPERILASAVDEYSRRMAEFNHRGDPGSTGSTERQ